MRWSGGTAAGRAASSWCTVVSQQLLARLHRWSGVGSSPRELGLILSYGLCAAPIAMINNLFVTYSYPLFVSGVLADSHLFLAAQTFFLVWNSGWLSDHTQTDATRGSKKEHGSIKRLKHIKYAGYLLGGAFLFAWFPWSTSSPPLAALHFLLSLCLYDGGLTYMEVNYSSLLADLSSKSQTRAWCNSAASLFSIIGSCTSFFGHIIYSVDVTISPHKVEPSTAFRLFCLGVVAVALLAVELSVRGVGHWARTYDDAQSEDVPMQQQHISSSPETPPSASPPPTNTVHERTATAQHQASIVNVRVAPALDSSELDTDATAPLLGGGDSSSTVTVAASDSAALTFCLFVRQLLSHRNFGLFCGLRLLQVFLCTFEKNHLSYFLDLLFGEFLSPSTRGLLISSSFVLPHVLLLVTSLYQQELGGVHAIIQKLFVSKIFVAGFMLLALTLGSVGGVHGLASSGLLSFMLVVYLCGSRVFTDVLHLRPSSMAASLIGTSSLLAKPGESLAPMLGWKVLRVIAETATSDAYSTVTTEADIAAASLQAMAARKQALLYLLLALPLVTVTLQLLLWSAFTLKGAYLKRITTRVQALDGESTEATASSSAAGAE